MTIKEAMKPYYTEPGIEIRLGDCRSILPGLGKVDLVCTDPPYGIGMAARGRIGTSKCAQVTDYGKSNWDDFPPSPETISQIISAGEHSIVWGGNFFGLPASSCWLVWDKDNTGDFADCELAWTNLDMAVRMFKWRWNGMLQENMGAKEKREHPTQKPLALMRWCLGWVPDAQTILDPFMGSGTTLVAAKLLGRRAIGIELEERYCEIAVRRLAQGVLPLRISEAPRIVEAELPLP